MEWLKKNKILLETTTIGIFSLVLLSNLMIVQYAKGYFEYYGVPLGEVNFVPQMYDYVQITLPALIATGIVLTTSYGILRFNDYVTEKFAEKLLPKTFSSNIPKFIKKHREVFGLLRSALNMLLKVITVGLLLYIIWTMASVVAPSIGNKSAGGANSYSSVSKKEDTLQDVIIYKSGNDVVLKTYDLKSHKFQDGYKVLSGTYTTHTMSKVE